MKKTEDNISMMREELEMMFFEEETPTPGSGDLLGATLGADL